MIKFKDIEWKEATYGTLMSINIKGMIVYHNQYDNVFSISSKNSITSDIANRISREEMIKIINE